MEISSVRRTDTMEGRKVDLFRTVKKKNSQSTLIRGDPLVETPGTVRGLSKDTNEGSCVNVCYRG